LVATKKKDLADAEKKTENAKLKTAWTAATTKTGGEKTKSDAATKAFNTA